MTHSKPVLGHLVYELTEACNQNCRFCYNHWRPDGCRKPDKRLAARTLRRILSQAEVGSISFSGGEPTLLGNIHDLALRCRFAGCGVNVLTNGTLITEDGIRNFANIGIGALQVPLLSADARVHEHLTGLAGSWEKACGTLRKSMEILGPEHTAAVLIVTAVNAGGVGESLELYDEMGIRTVMVNRFNLGGNGLKNRSELELDMQTLRTAFRTISDFSLRHPQMHFVSGVCTPICILDPRDYPGISFTTCSTDITDRPITISYSGEVRFCNHSPFVMGNIWERPLQEILADEAVRSRYSAVPEKCSSCRLFNACKGGCRAAAEQVYGRFDAVDPVLESQR